jgi:hypothetical protein
MYHTNGHVRARLSRYEKSGLTGTVPVWTLVFINMSSTLFPYQCIAYHNNDMFLNTFIKKVGKKIGI